MRKRIAAVLAAGLVLTALSGCASGGHASGAAPKQQTKAQACTAIDGDMKSVASDLESQVSKLATDPKAATTELQGIDATLKTSISKVTNPEVKEQATSFEKSFGVLVTQLSSYASNPESADTSQLEDAVTQVEDQGKKMTTLCG
ncbi:MAG TPA: hypothetical protein VGC45_13930 [Gryllotalpicola sp.]